MSMREQALMPAARYQEQRCSTSAIAGNDTAHDRDHEKKLFGVDWILRLALRNVHRARSAERVR